MKSQHLKIAIIAGIIAGILMFCFIKVNAETDPEQFKILTEMRVDIKYIKNNIQDIKENNKELKEQVANVKNRVTKVEERQVFIKKDVGEVTERNNWFAGLIGSILLLILGLQIKRSYNHRKDDGKTAH